MYEMKNLLNIGDEEDIIIVRTSSVDITEKVATGIEKALRKDRGEKIGEEDFYQRQNY